MTEEPSRREVRWSRVRFRVTATAAAVGLLGTVIGSVIFVAGLHESLEQALVTSAEQQTRSIVAQLESGAPARQTAVTGKDDIVVQVLDAKGAVEATDHPDVLVPIRTKPGTSEGLKVAGLPDSFAVHAERTADGRLVVVGLAEEQVTRATDTAIVLLAIAVPIGLVLLTSGVWLSVSRALRPVEEMRRQTATITSERLHERLEVPPGDDEIPLLATTLNAMLDRIDQSQQQQRQFVSDASHELRTPLATLRQTAEVARRHPGATAVEHLADEVLSEEARMERLVTALLTLARLDDNGPVHAQPVDLDDAVLREVDRVRGLRLDLELDRRSVSAGQAFGDPVLLGQVVTNVLTNAVRHARTTVRVSLDEVDDRVVFVVEDDGTGIPENERERVFQRFARLDEARSRDSGGSGLGLAIARKVVEVAGGTIKLGSSDLGGARFEVNLPAARP